MFDPETEVVQVESRLGRVGSIQAWDPWKSRQSVRHAKWWVSKVASLSYGNEAAKNPEALFKSIVERGHLSCLEFVPMLLENEESQWEWGSLPYQSLRTSTTALGSPRYWGDGSERARELRELAGDSDFQATAFLVECPLYTRSQWMRHRSFSYLEMSRRYTRGSKVGWSYYGGGDSLPRWFDGSIVENPVAGEEYDYYPGHVDAFHKACEAEYQRRLDAGWPNEIARGCMPVETMTKFWVAGFDRDWEAFLKLRDDAHAQPEIRVFASWIRNYLETKKVGAA